MEKEEHEIRKIMFEKNLQLILDGSESQSESENQKSTFIINADQFKALSREYNKVVKNIVD